MINGSLFFNTIVGVIELKGRFPGWIALAAFPTNPKALGTQGLTEKSSISLFRKNPAPSTRKPPPYPKFIVVVTLTALPYLSITE